MYVCVCVRERIHASFSGYRLTTGSLPLQIQREHQEAKKWSIKHDSPLVLLEKKAEHLQTLAEQKTISLTDSTVAKKFTVVFALLEQILHQRRIQAIVIQTVYLTAPHRDCDYSLTVIALLICLVVTKAITWSETRENRKSKSHLMSPTWRWIGVSTAPVSSWRLPLTHDVLKPDESTNQEYQKLCQFFQPPSLIKRP